ncbi:serine dehydratase subunit alpha family protein [Agrilactobacillus yilanensis]|uniref:UPF0597 protein ACFQ5M_09735 n=1 Tax=Agrilactobacillus yilanensis TaxID=2485997 RepID=A0ABW4J9R3_9LACO|nr:L-serine ammonia-lyase, iron-sulfur-dependent, subunit alpha [Agrilactobacillus yilanensis]
MDSTKMAAQFIDVLKDGVVAATGCTEPIAVAYGAANGRAVLADQTIQKIEVKVSPNIMKNAMAVIVPGTGEPGLLVAAAAGALCGQADAGLSVIANMTPADVPAVLELAHSGRVSAQVAAVDDDLYVEVSLTTAKDTVRVCIAGAHTNIFLVEKNDTVLFSKERPSAHATSDFKAFMKTVTFADIWQFAHNVDLKSIAFMKDAATVNMALAEEGLHHDYGLKLGRSIDQASTSGFGSGMAADLGNRIVAYTAAASDARMGGAPLPAMSNSGSGNQGITATCPVCVVAQHVNADEETLVRGITLSHLTALYIHAFLPVLSAFCATDSAAMGAAAGVVYLMDDDFQTACRSINNMASDAAGMICDGAGCSCAMKVATSVASMYRSVNLALMQIAVPASNGLVCHQIDETIQAIGRLGTEGLAGTDPTILNIMVEKKSDQVQEVR